MAESSTSLADVLSSLTQVAKTGTEVYSSVVGTQTDKLKEKSGIEQQKPAQVPPTASAVSAQKPSAPWYKAAWVIPSAIGAVLLIGSLFFFFRRKR